MGREGGLRLSGYFPCSSECDNCKDSQYATKNSASKIILSTSFKM